MAPEIPTTHQDYTVIVRRHSFLAWKWYAYVGSEYNGTLVDDGCAFVKFIGSRKLTPAEKKEALILIAEIDAVEAEANAIRKSEEIARAKALLHSEGIIP